MPDYITLLLAFCYCALCRALFVTTGRLVPRLQACSPCCWCPWRADRESKISMRGGQVWTTYMGRHRSVGTLQAVREIYAKGGGGLFGVSTFWAGTAPTVRPCRDFTKRCVGKHLTRHWIVMQTLAKFERAPWAEASPGCASSSALCPQGPAISAVIRQWHRYQVCHSTAQHRDRQGQWLLQSCD